MIKLITPPTVEPITLAEAKAQCRVESSVTEEDALITGYIAAARRWCERLGWQSCMTQTLELWLDNWPAADRLTLPRPPLQSVTSITYYDDDDAATVLASSAYYVDTVSVPGRVVLRNDASWPSATLRVANGIAVRFVAGWSMPSQVPETTRQAIQLIVGHWYENREAASLGAVSREIELGVRALLELEKVRRF